MLLLQKITNFETFCYIFISFYILLNKHFGPLVNHIQDSIFIRKFHLHNCSMIVRTIKSLKSLGHLFLQNKSCPRDSENHEGNSMLQTLYSETNFWETNFLDKLFLHSFQFIICTNIPHRILDNQQKRNFPFFNKGFQNFCVKLCYRHYKKINLQFFAVFFFYSLQWPIYIFNTVVNTKLPAIFCVHLTLFSL